MGNLKEFGEWNPAYSVKLFWSEGDHWNQTLDIEVEKNQSKKIEYKLIETDFSKINLQELAWSNGPNCVLVINPETETSLSPSVGKKMFLSTSKNGNSASIDCKNLSLYRLSKKLEHVSAKDFILLQHIPVQRSRIVMSLMPQHMMYLPEVTDGLICPIFYKHTAWKLVQGRIYADSETQFGAWTIFKGKHETKFLVNFQFDLIEKECFMKRLQDDIDAGEIPCSNYQCLNSIDSLIFEGISGIMPRASDTNYQRIVKPIALYQNESL